MSILTLETPAVQSDPDIDTTDHAETFEPSPEDAEWWASVCDHSDWTHEGDLSPEEEADELAWNDRLEERAEMATACDRYEAGFGW